MLIVYLLKGNKTQCHNYNKLLFKQCFNLSLHSVGEFTFKEFSNKMRDAHEQPCVMKLAVVFGVTT